MVFRSHENKVYQNHAPNRGARQGILLTVRYSSASSVQGGCGRAEDLGEAFVRREGSWWKRGGRFVTFLSQAAGVLKNPPAVGAQSQPK